MVKVRKGLQLHFVSVLALKTLYILLGIYFLCTLPGEYWFYPLIGYVIVGLFNSIGHRYFAHNQYQVSKVGRAVLGLLATIGAYTNLLTWRIIHQHHHVHSDTEKDVHSPKYGKWRSSFFWIYSPKTLLKVVTDKNFVPTFSKLCKDPIFLNFSKYFVPINLAFCLILILLNWKILAYGYLTGYFLEHIRFGLVNYGCHKKSVGSYRNFDTPDESYNNWILGILSLGFAWHNNHHQYPARLSTQIKWWEFDLEEKFSKFLMTIFSIDKSK